MPTVKQVAATLPVAFRQEYPATFAIVNASGLFLEAPSTNAVINLEQLETPQHCQVPCCPHSKWSKFILLSGHSDKNKSM